jgi:two-component system, NtrC family, sensor kinase
MRLVPKTIRQQITTAFLFCFVFMAAIIGVNYSSFKRLSGSMKLFELAEDLNNTIMEMRRYEKNYFLYRQNFNFEENLTFTNRLSLLLRRERESLVTAMGEANFENFVTSAQEYADLMSKLHLRNCDGNGCTELEAAVRGIGQNLIILGDNLVTTERASINRHLGQMIQLPMISLVLLVSLLGFVIFFIGEKVIRPLARITRESEAVARGDFQRITSYGAPQNEIHHLVTAINCMMTELENRQEQLIQSRKIASIGTLTAGIAHEINNPVNNISLILESLLEVGDEMDDEERNRLYQEAMDQADRTSEIVKNLLEFSRASHPRVEKVSLVEIVAKTARLVGNELSHHKIRFVKEIRNEPPRILVDKGGLQQVLLNLFVNSIQAMNSGGELKVIIDIAPDSTEARIDVVDTGPGIPKENIERVFDPFFTTKQEGIGTGLGLSVSYNIVQKNGGRMVVKSAPGEGTCFTIYLPIEASTNLPE